MCLLLAAHAQHPDYRLIIAANRDEFYGRPAAPATYWSDNSAILGGRDLEGGGTWLAVNRSGAFAAITNIPGSAVSAPRSRGLIVNDYLTGQVPPKSFVDTLEAVRYAYAGFNVLASDANSLAWYSNQGAQAQSLSPGIYALSNHLLDTPWPKVARIKADFRAAQALTGTALIDALFASLANEHNPSAEALTETGVSGEYERRSTPIFVAGESYGPRCSTIVLVSHTGDLSFIERRFGPHKSFLGESVFEFEIDRRPT